MGAVVIILYLGIIVLMIASMWKLFEKAGKPGWAAIVPIYNIIVMLEIIEKPIWWIALFFVPIANFVIMLMIYYYFVKAFGKDGGFFVGVLFLPFIFFPMLAFGDAQYVLGKPQNNVDTLD